MPKLYRNKDLWRHRQLPINCSTPSLFYHGGISCWRLDGTQIKRNVANQTPLAQMSFGFQFWIKKKLARTHLQISFFSGFRHCARSSSLDIDVQHSMLGFGCYEGCRPGRPTSLAHSCCCLEKWCTLVKNHAAYMNVSA